MMPYHQFIPPSDSAAEYVPPPDILGTLERTHEGNDVEIPGPVLQAASLSDTRILRGLLKSGFPATNYIVGPLNSPWQSALVNAIFALRAENAKILLGHGANPNGFPDWCFLQASSRFIRGRPSDLTVTGGCHLPLRAEVLDHVKRSDDTSALASDQTADLTEAELKLRRIGRSRFWSEVDFPLTDYPTNNPSSSLSAATAVRDNLLYLHLIEHGADESAWKNNGTLGNQVAGVPSSWAVESPLWIVVRNKDHEFLQFLLKRGHKPDHFPSSLITRPMNAISYAIATNWRDGFDTMAPLADMSLATPVYQCHLVHFAIATLDLGMVKHMLSKYEGSEAIVLRSIPKTALGHGLLHLASLPLDDTFLNMHSLQCYTSIHDFRTLETAWRPLQLQSTAPVSSGRRARGGRGRSSNRPPQFSLAPPHDFEEQEEVIRYLFSMLPSEELQSQDIYGNTPLHYLASVRHTNGRLIDWLKDLPAGEAAWTTSNSWGFSAQNLLESGKASESDWSRIHMPFWKRG
ncbi:hypothetical protein PFICI_02965 [Pestalotiopsis fici W106-1]|uniref:Uncharacterized protein n=1 Tax=Pestalotiopsis fici (strain W106-1 / CGMCC3.15140) TaxID=1229662 RepID=W3XFX9_PESFW|nr:uncharacterized protein PFICI_02965 [Pestalotiopsis fici W106-1]ETS84940.1 hypothetical protein PFICI_02965 [Pestalotiopsis fici W106-1]